MLKGIRDAWDGGIDLHGQLIDRAFSFTMIGASERDFSKNQRVLQTVRGAWEDAEKRFEWADAYIKPNDAPPQPDDPRMYGVQWGTVWDTIGYTVTGALGDWIDSPTVGLGADGIDNEMSFSHIINCGTGACFIPDFEQLHIDGNKSLIYAQVNFTHITPDETFRAPGRVGYVLNPALLENEGVPVPPPTEGLDPQPGIVGADLSPFTTPPNTFEFEIFGPEDGFYNGGAEAKVTHLNLGGIGAGSGIPSVSAGTSLVLERYRPVEPGIPDDTGCGTADDNWEEVNRYYNQSSIYLQAGQAVHANQPQPGRWRVCMTGGLASQIIAGGGHVKLDIWFSTEQAWADPGQIPYSVSNMKFFQDLAGTMEPGQLQALNVDDILAGSVDLHQFTSLIVADDPLPGYTEPEPTGPAQEGQSFQNPGLGTLPCAFSPGLQPVLPPTCVNDFEFDIHPEFNNQKLIVELVSDPPSADWDLYVERQSRISGEWFGVGQSTSPTGNERVAVSTPPAGHYRARVVNWDAVDSSSARTLSVDFSNVYEGPPIPPSERTDEERDAWGAALREFAEGGGNLVLTDAALKNLAYMDIVPRGAVNTFSVFAGYIGFTRDGLTDTYGDPLAHDVNQPGAAEGPQFRHQTYEPVPLGYSIGDAPANPDNTSPVWSVDQIVWEALGARTAGITTADQATLGELRLGAGSVRIIGPLLPPPTDRFYHPFGLANYALTYTGYQVLSNVLQWERPLPDLAISADDLEFSSTRFKGADRVTINVTVRNPGAGGAHNVAVAFFDNGAAAAPNQTIGSIPAGGSAVVSFEWDARQKQGTHTLTAVADPLNAIAESNEANNSASVVVEVKGNRVRNHSFEESSDGSSPDAWSSDGDTRYESGGSDGDRSVSAGPGGSWTSTPIEVEAGKSYGVSVDIAGTSGSLVVEQLSATGQVLGTATQLLSIVNNGVFQSLEDTLVIAEGVTHVRIKLMGGLTGVSQFDNVLLWEE